MQIIGHPFIPSQKFIHIQSHQDIDSVLANCIVWWDASQDPDLSLAKFCQENKIQYAVQVSHLKELIFFAHLGAKYLITTTPKAQQFQSIIKEYLLDCLLLCIIEDENEIEKLATLGIDGVIFYPHLQIHLH
ncbi:hypothetical protein [Helicobacter kayseriensis]|uniref:hypothetical protein n=1 Tax=Helicobacter kayseriensis TaxID=2905877 RepID=UPI001E4479EE|nr:hypothetical protein [Helicobacter kayseriensis]MCE3047006.1 hypothetical protein [Helicobacter kayseriensis]MCE3048334.1 hypothetical protein [Helicobacter kayseriensis]